VLALAGCVLVLAACTTTAPPSAEPAPPLPPESSPAAGTGSAGLDRFVAALQEQLPEVVVDRRDEEVAALATRACAARSRAAALTREFAAEGLTTGQARRVISLALRTACPA
jgi:hypothetical protein